MKYTFNAVEISQIMFAHVLNTYYRGAHVQAHTHLTGEKDDTVIEICIEGVEEKPNYELN